MSVEIAQQIRRHHRASVRLLHRHLARQFILSRTLREMDRQMGRSALRQWAGIHLRDIPWGDLEFLLNSAPSALPPNNDALNEILSEEN